MSAGSDYFSDDETERSNEHEIEEEQIDDIDIEILHPENPLMIQFQETLKKLLTNKLRQFQDEVNQFEYEIKILKHEKEIEAEKLYDQRKEVNKLRKSVEECSESLTNLITKRQHEEEQLAREKELRDKELTELKKTQKIEAELRKKIESHSNLLHHLKNIEKEQASNLAVVSQMISKNKTDLKYKLTEKNKQDYLLLRLENEVYNIEMEIKSYEKQVKNICEEIAKLSATLAERENEYQNEKEYNDRLMNDWKAAINMVSKRDQKCLELREKLEKKNTEYKSVLAEINNYERMAEKEMAKSELLVSLLNRREADLKSIERSNHDLMKSNIEAKEQIAELDSMIECTEKNLKEADEELQEQQREWTALQKTKTKLNEEKYKLEESTLVQLQNEMVSNKEASKLYNEIKNIREEITKMQALAKDYEETYRVNEQVIKTLQKDLETSEMCVEEKRSKINALEEEVRKYEKELKHLKMQVQQENSALDKKRKELKLLQEKSPKSELEEELAQVEEDIKNVTEEIEQKKKEWVRKQNEVVLLSEKNSRRINELNELRKNIDLLQQTLYQQEENIRKAEQDEKKIDKTTEFLLHQISQLNSQHYQQKCLEEKLNSQNFIDQNEILGKLKESEHETEVTMEEIEELEKTKKSLQEKLLQLQREDLEWEKKIKLVKEMKRNMQQEESENGDIGSMKNEIHRMEIRYAQLKKAQDSLAADLQRCVLKRDHIIDQNIVKEKNKKSAVQAQQALERKIRNAEADVAKLEKRLKHRQEEYAALEKEQQQFNEEVKQAQMAIEKLEFENQELEAKLRDLSHEKHKNLEIIIRKQKFLKFLNSVKSGKIKDANIDEETVRKNYSKNLAMNTDLCNALESLCNELPQLKDEIIPILNIAQAKFE